MLKSEGRPPIAREQPRLRRIYGAFVALVGILATVASALPVLADYGTTPALQLPFPTGVQWNVSGFSYYYTPGCGIYPNDHQGLEKYAIDFGMSNSEIDAAAYGQVGAIGYDSAGGQYVWISHPNNIQTYYGHLSTAPGDMYVTVGQTVAKGQALAKSDTSGSAIGPHLHFRASTGGTSAFSGTGYMPEPMSGTGPPGYINWQNYGCAGDSTTTFTSTPPLEQVAVAARPVSAEDLLARGTDGALFYAPTDTYGTPLSWTRVGGIIKGTPCGVWNANGDRLDVYAVDTSDRANHIIYTGPGGQGTWGQWNPQTGLVAGHSETEAITCTRRPDGTMDLFIRGPAGDALHDWTNGNGDVVGSESLGGIVKGAPAGAWDSSQTHLDIFAIDIYDRPNRKTYAGSWGQWLVQSGLAGLAESETISVVRRSDGTLDTFVRGTPGAAYHGWTDLNGNILNWESLAGIVKGAPFAKWGWAGGPDSTRLDVFAVASNDQLALISYNGGWGQWNPLPGGGVVG
jgi:murein DD-endopeptidase MepM/ murein hydrolase activator NlpD